MTLPPDTKHGSAAILNAESKNHPLHHDKLVRVKGQKLILGGLQIIYRGLDADTILINFTLIDLDPESAYRHRISLDAARRGFRLADQKFQLVSAIRFRLKIALNKGELGKIHSTASPGTSS